MVNIKIPEWVKEHLSQGEQVISEISIRNTDVYATNKRLLRFTSKSKFDVLEYDKASITFTKYGLGTSIFRIFAVLFGLFCISLGIFTYIGPEYQVGTTLYRMKAPFAFSLLFLGIGLIVIVAALWGRYGYYQIEYPDLDKKNLKNWRIMRNRWFSGKADRFAEIIKERTSQS